MRDHHRRLLALPVAHMAFLDAPREALSTAMTHLLTDLRAAELTGPDLPLT